MIQAETLTLKTGGALAVNALIAAYGIGELKDLISKVHEGLTETGHYTPKEKLTLPEIPFKI